MDVLVHGEYERNDMVEYFGESLGGFLFTKFGWVQSYGTRCVKPPIIWGDVYRDKPITVDWSVFAQSQTDKIMKGMLTGPVTILNWSFPREDISIEEIADFCHYSPSHFMKFFKSHMGMGFIEYLNDYRLTIAARQLVSSDESILTVASLSGFDNLSYFNRLFRRKYHTTPGAYRKKTASDE